MNTEEKTKREIVENTEETAGILNEYSVWEENEIIMIALRQIQVRIFVYDILLQKIFFLTNEVCPDQNCWKKSEYTREEFLEAGNLSGEYKEAVREQFLKIERGEDYAGIRVRHRVELSERWLDIVMTGCANSRGQTVRAIGTIQEAVNPGESGVRYLRELKYREAMLADCRRVYEINVTKDRFTKLETMQDSTDTGDWEQYTLAMNHLRETRVYRGDWEAFLEIADREHLMRGYQAGKTEFYCEYRVVDEQGNLTWSSSATHLLEDPTTKDVKGFIYIKDIDRQKKWELELAKQAECDPLTGIYNRRTAQQLITQKLQEAGKDRIYGFLMMDLDDFKYVNDHYGHSKGDLLLQKIARQIDMIVTERDVFARLGGDEFIAFLYEEEDRSRVKRIADLICDTVRSIKIIREQQYVPSISIGIALYPDSGSTFAELYEAADQALYHVKRNGKNDMEFYQKDSQRLLF